MSKKITHQDILNALVNLRQDLYKEIQTVKTGLEIKMDELDLRVQDRLREHRSEMFTKFDSWARELETAREDRTISTKLINDHEKRLKKLERGQN